MNISMKWNNVNRTTDEKIKELIEKSKGLLAIDMPIDGVFNIGIFDCYIMENEDVYPQVRGKGHTLDDAIDYFIDRNKGKQLCVHPYCSDEHRFTL